MGEYDFYPDWTFEGEYINGALNGKGKEYVDYKLFYDGEYLNGIKNGKGKEYNRYYKYNPYNILLFEGEYLDGIRNKGKEYNSDGKLIFEWKKKRKKKNILRKWKNKI